MILGKIAVHSRCKNALGGTDKEVGKAEKLVVHICPRYTAEK